MVDNVLAQIALNAKTRDGVKKLQESVNQLHDYPVLKVDNVFGPKTATAAFETMRDFGYEDLVTGMA